MCINIFPRPELRHCVEQKININLLSGNGHYAPYIIFYSVSCQTILLGMGGQWVIPENIHTTPTEEIGS
jgi:hypothetical protein